MKQFVVRWKTAQALPINATYRAQRESSGKAARFVKESVVFSPLLALYVLVVLLASTDTFQGDESRYVWFANNLSRGYYSPTDDTNLWNGPGYPIVLLPFVLLQLPLVVAKLSNALFLFGAVIYFYYTLRLYVQERPARYFSYLMGIYPPLLREAHLLLTESLTLFLVTGFLFHFCRLHRNERSQWTTLLTASGFLGYLALTKVFFGYVILAALLSNLALYLWKKTNAFQKTLLVFSFALLFCLPYLFYTYSLTGKIFYWGDAGGMSLYWMSTPYEDESGDWYAQKDLDDNPQLARHHEDFFNKLSTLNSIQRDDELKRQAVYNIIHYPTKFVMNWAANVGRLLFSYPFSYTPQKLSTFFYILPNMFIVVGAILCIYPSYRGRRSTPGEIYALLLFALIAFGGSSLLSAYERQFRVLVPIFSLWVFFTLTRIVKIEIRQ